MKTKLCIVFVAAVLAGSCAKRKFRKDIAGTWVPYEIVNSDSTVDTGPFRLRNIFGVYAESVEFRNDNTFVPMQEIQAGELSPKTEEAGVYAYKPRYAELSLTEGAFDQKYTVEKLEDDQLWLHASRNESLLKFKRR